MNQFPETKAAWEKLKETWKNLKWVIRAALCEDAISFAYWVCPKGYIPTPSQMLADEIRHHTVEKQWKKERECPETTA